MYLRIREARAKSQFGEQNFLEQACYVNSFLYTCLCLTKLLVFARGPWDNSFIRSSGPWHKWHLLKTLSFFLSPECPLVLKRKSSQPLSIWLFFIKSQDYTLWPQRGVMGDHSEKPKATGSISNLSSKPYQPICGSHLEELTSKDNPEALRNIPPLFSPQYVLNCACRREKTLKSNSLLWLIIPSFLPF